MTTEALGLALLVLVLGACGSDEPDASPEPSSPRPVVPDSMTIPRMLETDARFSTLRAALDSTGLDSLLATNGPFTLFAPPNEAFGALPPGTVDALLSEQTGRLRAILSRHLVERPLSTGDVSTPQTILTRGGDTLSLRPTPDGVSIGDATVVDGNIEAANGHLHVIDRVLRPPPASDAP